MDIRKLETFIYLCKTMSFSKTGEKLFLTQPAVSRQMKSLEEEIGHPLFVFSSNLLTLTKAGEHLLNYAEVMLEMEEKCKREINDIYTGNRHYEIGYDENLANSNYLQILAKAMSNHVTASFRLSKCDSCELEDKLLCLRLDYALLSKRPQNEALSWARIGVHPYVACFTKDHPLTSSDTIDWNRIKRYPVCALFRPNIPKDIQVKATLDSYEALFSFLEEGYVAILPEGTIMNEAYIQKAIEGKRYEQEAYLACHSKAKDELFQEMISFYAQLGQTSL